MLVKKYRDHLNGYSDNKYINLLYIMEQKYTNIFITNNIKSNLDKFNILTNPFNHFESKNIFNIDKLSIPIHKIIFPDTNSYITGSPLNYLIVSNPSETPNYIIFSIKKFYYVSERLHVVVYSYDTTTKEFIKHIYYCSNSDLNFYRYCVSVKYSDNKMYHKGYNYVSTTFINIGIQKFIDEQREYYKTDIQYDIDCIDINDVKDNLLKSRINTMDYISTNEVFELLNELFPHVITISDYKKIIQILIDKLDNNINKMKNKIKFEFKDELFNELYEILKKNDVNKVLNKESRTEFYIRLKHSIEEFILKHFIIMKDTKQFIYKKTVSIGSITFDINIYTIKIKSIDYDRYYNIVYMIYKMDGKDYKNIVHIYPANNTITQYGMELRYVSAGILINKSFDYKSQAAITFVRKGDKGIVEDTSNYIFIGDFTNYLFLP